MKKLLALFLVAFLTFGVVLAHNPQVAYASSSRISVSGGNGYVGERVTVTVSLSGSGNVSGGHVALQYDGSILELVNAESGNLGMGAINENYGPNTVYQNWANTSTKTSGTVMRLTFRLKKEGRANLRITDHNLEGVSNVSTSNNHITSTKFVTPSSVSLNKSNINLNVGETDSLSATVSPSNATNKNVSYSSSNTSVATVNSSGTVSAVGEGTATITVTTQSGNRTATANVKVSAIPVESIELSESHLELIEEDTAEVSATVRPNNATNKSVTWSSADENIATVSSDGVITARREGSTVITAESNNGVTAEVSVDVSAPERIAVEYDLSKDSNNFKIDMDKLKERPAYREVRISNEGVEVLIPATVLLDTIESYGITDYSEVYIKVDELDTVLPRQFRSGSPIFTFSLMVDDVKLSNFSESIRKTFNVNGEVEDWDNLALYWHNPDTDQWVKQITEANQEENTVTAYINHWSTYALLEDSTLSFIEAAEESGADWIIVMIAAISNLMIGAAISYFVLQPKGKQKRKANNHV
ncbi:Ig-like domain-containing protein [Proteinivorax hydrogeniformans]|uniref:Ig-like domain-containing protein n=1 Tax=Proteinivorax hydrogeniformans TaxID=1826727 RepID=A0AAU8HWX1_9FIRM